MKDELRAMKAVLFKKRYDQVPNGQEGFAEIFRTYGIEEQKSEIRAKEKPSGSTSKKQTSALNELKRMKTLG